MKFAPAFGTAAANTLTLTIGWHVWRTPQGPDRWGWYGHGQRGLVRGTAKSRAVAEVRAKRAAGLLL